MVQKVAFGRGSGTVTINAAATVKTVLGDSLSGIASNLFYDEGEFPAVSSCIRHYKFYRDSSLGFFTVRPVMVFHDTTASAYTDNVESSVQDLRTVLDESFAGQFDFRDLGLIIPVSRDRSGSSYFEAEGVLNLTPYLRNFLAKFYTSVREKSTIEGELLLIFNQPQNGATGFISAQQIKYNVRHRALTDLLSGPRVPPRIPLPAVIPKGKSWVYRQRKDPFGNPAFAVAPNVWNPNGVPNMGWFYE